MPAATHPTFSVHSISFSWAGSPAIPLRDYRTMGFAGDLPEWSAAGHHAPVAFAAAAVPRVQVVFARRGDAPDGTWRMGARGAGCPGLLDQDVTLRWNAHGLSGPHTFTADAPLHCPSGIRHLVWHWRAGQTGADHALAATRHEVLVTRSAPVPPASWASKTEMATGPYGDPKATWMYETMARWACTWAAAQVDDKAICDRLLAAAHRTGLRYALPAWDVRTMLQKGGGYCGGWQRWFRALVGVHGVTLVGRCFWTDWRSEPDRQARWCAIVVDSPGCNRAVPAEGPSTFHDMERGPTDGGEVRTHVARRYRFWGQPDVLSDGHCIDFLHYRGRWYLYDPCFTRAAVALEDFSPPEPDGKTHVPVEQLGTFKRAYLDRAVNYMLGSIELEGTLYESVHDPHGQQPHEPPTKNGLTVPTTVIPDRNARLTFFWTT